MRRETWPCRALQTRIASHPGSESAGARPACWLKSLRAGRILGEDVGEIVPRAHRVIGNLKTWLHGTCHGVSGDHLQFYLDEFVFRFNRRRTPLAAFQTLLGRGSRNRPTTYKQIAG